MNLDQFWHILKTDFAYQSPTKKRIHAQPPSSWTNFRYYTRLFRHLLQQSIIARTTDFNNRRWASGSLGVIKIVESVGGEVNVSGLEVMKKYPGPMVFIANHMSLLETFVLPCVTLAFKNVTFVVKEELMHYPIICWVMRAVNLIAVSRRDPRQDLKIVLQRGREFLANGGSVVIFPQATRSTVFDAQMCNTMGVKLAQRTGVPVVPVAIKTDFQGNGKMFKDMGSVDPRKPLYFKFGEPMAVKGNPRIVHQNVVDYIARNVRDWGGEVV